MKTREWFKIRCINDVTWAIDDHSCDIMYLICGDKRCLLLDTGWGIGDLQSLKNSLSPLPLIVVNSHGHPDHTFGNSSFSQIHIHASDAPFVSNPPSPENRTWILKNILPKPLPVDFKRDKWATSVPSLMTFQDGHVFDLGNRSLRVISVPGHSPGSICLLDSEAQLLFTGDSVLSGPIWLHLDESTPLSQFYRNLKGLQAFATDFKWILPAHADLKKLPLSKEILNELVNGIKQILDGKLVGREEVTFAGKGLRCDFNSCGIVYRPDRL